MRDVVLQLVADRSLEEESETDAESAGSRSGHRRSDCASHSGVELRHRERRP